MSKRMRTSAWQEHCTIRLPGCLPGTETTVLAHLPNMSMGKKNNDYNAAYSCFSCHQILDGAVLHDFEKNWLDHMHRMGQERTLNRMIESGVIKN